MGRLVTVETDITEEEDFPRLHRGGSIPQSTGPQANRSEGGQHCRVRWQELDSAQSAHGHQAKDLDLPISIPPVKVAVAKWLFRDGIRKEAVAENRGVGPICLALLEIAGIKLWKKRSGISP